MPNRTGEGEAPPINIERRAERSSRQHVRNEVDEDGTDHRAIRNESIDARPPLAKLSKKLTIKLVAETERMERPLWLLCRRLQCCQDTARRIHVGESISEKRCHNVATA